MFYNENSFFISLPIVSITIVVILFLMHLKWRTSSYLIGDIGALYIIILFAYSIAPAVEWFSNDLFVNDNSGLLEGFNDQIIVFQLWRHFLYITSFAIAFSLFRGKNALPQKITIRYTAKFKFLVLFLFIVLFCSILINFILSAPVENYYDNYSRFDHLDLLWKRLTSVFTRLRLGTYIVLLGLIFLFFNKNKLILLSYLIFICLFEIIFTHGARIQVLIIILSSMGLFHFTIKPITVKNFIFLSAFLVFIFSLTEIIRLISINNLPLSEISFKFKLPGELGSVFAPAIFLYEQKEMNSLPNAQNLMFFYEFISLISFGDDGQFNPMEWFRENYFPTSTIPPWTLGPLAESAIWGGEMAIFLYAVANGIFFSFIVTWFTKNYNKWWVTITYIFLYASSLLTIKYSVFYLINPFIKNLLPVIIISLIIIKLGFKLRNFK